MKKALLSFLFIFSLFLPGCGRASQQIPLADSRIEDQRIFQNNLQCAALAPRIVEGADSFNKSQKPEKRISNGNTLDEAPKYDSYIEQQKYQEIFFSPKTGGCLYVLSTQTLMQSADRSWTIMYEYQGVFDALSSKSVEDIKTISRGESFSSKQELEALINKYKNRSQ